jgi:hypothetical protein
MNKHMSKAVEIVVVLAIVGALLYACAYMVRMDNVVFRAQYSQEQ